MMDQRLCRARKKSGLQDDWSGGDTRVRLQAKTPSSHSKSPSPSGHTNSSHLGSKMQRRGSVGLATGSSTLPKAPRSPLSKKASDTLPKDPRYSTNNSTVGHSGIPRMRSGGVGASALDERAAKRVQRLSINSRQTPSMTRRSSSQKDKEPVFYTATSPAETSGFGTRQKISARYTPIGETGGVGLVQFDRSAIGGDAVSVKSGYVVESGQFVDKTPALSANRSPVRAVSKLTHSQEVLLAEYLQKVNRNKKEMERIKERLNGQVQGIQDLKVTELRNLRRELESKLKEFEQSTREDLSLVERRVSRLEDLEYEVKYKQSR